VRRKRGSVTGFVILGVGKWHYPGIVYRGGLEAYLWFCGGATLPIQQLIGYLWLTPTTTHLFKKVSLRLHADSQVRKLDLSADGNPRNHAKGED
jgi:hypothetical protein